MNIKNEIKGKQKDDKNEIKWKQKDHKMILNGIKRENLNELAKFSCDFP